MVDHGIKFLRGRGLKLEDAPLPRLRPLSAGIVQVGASQTGLPSHAG